MVLACTEYWCTMYTKYSNRIKSHQGSVFKSEIWKMLFESTALKIRLSRIGAHSTLGIGERLPKPLPRI